MVRLLVSLFFRVVIIFAFLYFLLSAKESDSIISRPVINEIMSINTTTIQDRDGDYPDWIELYNPGDSLINLTGYGFSDDTTDPLKWIFPSTILQPGEFKLVFASDKNYMTEEDYLHTNFKIKSDGEMLILSDSSGSIIDRVEAVQMKSDQSWGRQPDGSTTWLFFDQPTPGSTNNTGGFIDYSPDVDFTLAGGFYSDQLTVEINCASSDPAIHYTTDCSEPDENSPLYTGSILISETTVLKARSYLDDLPGGNVFTQTYLIDEDITFPVISLSTDDANLFDPDSGIYTNFWDDWERPIHFEFFETDGTQPVNVDAGIKIGGGATRRRSQKTFKIYFRSEYGTKSIYYQIFPNLPIFEFSTLFLRNSGNDWDQTHFRDAFLQTLVGDLDLDTQAYSPAVIFLNGEYWGILNIRERLTKDYLATHYGANPDEVDLLEIAHPNDFVSVIEGDLTRFNSLYSYIEANDFSNDESYDYIKNHLDINNFIDFLISEIYFNNTDWPTNNIKFWHPGTEKGKFRMMLFDLDWSYGYQRLRIGPADENTYKANTLTWALQEDKLHIGYMFRKFLENQRFKMEFINRFADYLNTVFLPENVQPVIDAIKLPLEVEMPRHYDKFKSDPISAWYNSIDVLENFAKNRPPYIRQHIMNYFGISDTVPVNLQISPVNSGSISINHISISDSSWQGKYFTDVPVTFTAVPNIGYKFTGWNGDADTDSLIISRILTGEQTLIANFERDDSVVQGIIINEINYHSADDFDTGDWIELYNALDNTTDISGWIIRDENDPNGFTMPSKTVIEPYGYLVLCSNTWKFHQMFSQVSNYMGDLGFAFDNAGERISLYNNQNILVDSVCYSDSYPWPVQPDGNGPTLLLKNPNLDNGIAKNWTSSNDHGTPGSANQSVSAMKDEENTKVPSTIYLEQNYPNPFNSNTKISYTLPHAGFITLTVYDILGNELFNLVNQFQKTNRYLINFDASGLSSGLYFYRLQVSNSFFKTKKMLLIK